MAERNSPHGYSPFLITSGGLLQLAMEMFIFCTKNGSWCCNTLQTSTSGQETPISTSAVTGTFQPPTLRKSVGSSQTPKLT